jgi:hypothetical protein
MSDRPEIPHRRHQLVLKLEADDMDAMLSALRAIEHDLLLKERDHDWNHPVDITSGGTDSGWHLTIDSDLTITSDAYRTSLMDWHRTNVESRQRSLWAQDPDRGANT